MKYTITIKDNENNKEEKFEAIDYIFSCIVKKENGINYSNYSFSHSNYLDLTRLHLQISEHILQGFRKSIKKKEE